MTVAGEGCLGNLAVLPSNASHKSEKLGFFPGLARILSVNDLAEIVRCVQSPPRSLLDRVAKVLQSFSWVCLKCSQCKVIASQ